MQQVPGSIKRSMDMNYSSRAACIQPCKAPLGITWRAVSAAAQYLDISNSRVPRRRVMYAHNVRPVTAASVKTVVHREYPTYRIFEAKFVKAQAVAH